VPFLFFSVQVQAGGFDAGVAGVALQELDVDKRVEQAPVISVKLQINSFGLDL
jgi:hypothetical protein